MSGPDFIYIGPTKTGSSWLYKNLRAHPEIGLPPIKEIRYFWEQDIFGGLNTLSKWWYNHYKNYNHWHFQSIRFLFVKRIKFHLNSLAMIKFSYKDILWDYNFFFKKHNDYWYFRLFPKDKVCGDISPQYFELPETEIAKIKSILPNLKIIIGLRDPVERLWSHIKMDLCNKKNRKLSEIDMNDIIHYINQNPQHQLFDYISVIETWKKYFGENHLLVYFYEELHTDPIKLFKKICRFLNVSDTYIKKDLVLRKINKGVEGEIPDIILKDLLIDNFYYLKKMKIYFSEKYPTNWYHKYQGL